VVGNGRLRTLGKLAAGCFFFFFLQIIRGEVQKFVISQACPFSAQQPFAFNMSLVSMQGYINVFGQTCVK
jgi:hypothetical protein